MRYIRYIRYKMRVYHMYRDTKKIHFSGGRKKKTCITIHVYFMILVIQNTMYHDTQKMKKNSKKARRYMKIQVIQAVSPYLVRIYPEYWYQTTCLPTSRLSDRETSWSTALLCYDPTFSARLRAGWTRYSKMCQNN